MPNLIAKTALSGQTPAIHAGTTLTEVSLGQITSIAAFAGQQGAVAEALGQPFPAPNTHSAGLCWVCRLISGVCWNNISEPHLKLEYYCVMASCLCHLTSCGGDGLGR